MRIYFDGYRPLLANLPRGTMRTKSAGPIFQPSLPSQRERNTLRACHNQTVCRLASLPVPPPLSVYDTAPELGHLLLDQVAYLRQVVDAVSAVFECAADDAADYGGARIESFDLVRAATEDFVAPITDAAERLTGEN
jgi:hypothetical protein